MNIDDILGPYRILGKLGAGGMGEVYRATDTNLKRQVAIKVLPASMAADADRLARFQREAEVLAALNHPNIAVIYGLERAADVTALVMELVEGEDLSAHIARHSTGAHGVPSRVEGRGAIPLADALPIATQIAEALEAAHEQGIIHRDLKPANIKVRTDGTVKVLDFGLAKAMDPAAASSSGLSMSPTITTPAMTQAGMILGTAAYMAPEQARGKAVDRRADIWAFGAVLFEMLSGRRPFDGEDTTEVLGAVVRLEPPWDTLPATLPARITQVLRACLQKDPKRRIGDMQSVRLALEGAFETAAPHATATSTTPRGGRAWMVAAASSLLTALVVLAGTTYFRTESPTLPTMRFEFSHPTTPNPVQFSVSPDGRYVVSVAGTQKGVALWLRALEGPDRFLKDTDGGQDPFWSPDSRHIGFFADKTLKIIDIMGGPARPIADAPGGLGGSWNEDGTILFARDARGPIYRVAATGGTPVAVTELDKTREETDHVGPRFLAGGQRFVYLARSSKPEHHNLVYLGSLDSKSRTKLGDATGWPAFAPPGYLLFQRTTTLLAQRVKSGSFQVTGEPQVVMEGLTPGNPAFARPGFSVSRSGVLVARLGGSNTDQLMWFSRTDAPNVIAAQEYRNLRLSPDGRRVAGEEPDSGGGDIWLLDLARNTPTRFTFDAARDFSPIWSPDGQRVAFASNRDGVNGIYVKHAGGTTPEELVLKSQFPVSPTNWSADGTFIVYTEMNPKTKADVWILPLSGERTPTPVLQTPYSESAGRLSPDGRWIAYVSNESGQDDVYVQSVPASGNKWKISNNGGVSPLWRRDGKALFYNARLNAGIMSVDIKAQKSPGQFEVGIPQPVVRARVSGSFDVTADGQRFLVNGREAAASESSALTVIVNWTTALGAGK